MFIDWVVHSVFVHSESTRIVSIRECVAIRARLMLGPIGHRVNIYTVLGS